jgi:mono/diheme cytochrome c family protein
VTLAAATAITVVVVACVAVGLPLATTTAAQRNDSAKVPGNSVTGKHLFVAACCPPCATCHTLRAARAKGKEGPDLDTARPTYGLIVRLITNGSSFIKRYRTEMPAYGGAYGSLTKRNIQDIAAFVYAATHSH